MFLLASERVNIIQRERENLQINQSISTTNSKMAAAERRNCVRIQHIASCKINKYLCNKLQNFVYITVSEI